MNVNVSVSADIPTNSTEIQTSKSPSPMSSPERASKKSRREKKRKEIEEEKAKLKQLQESRTLKTMKKEELKRMKEQMLLESQKELEQEVEQEQEQETFIELDSEEENETIQEVYRGVFLLDGKYYVVDAEGDGAELVEYQCTNPEEMVTSAARALLAVNEYKKEKAEFDAKMDQISKRATEEHIKSIIQIQTRIRCRHDRRLPEIAGMKERKNLVKELIDSEHKYVDNLNILKKYYLEKILSEKDDKVLKNCLKNLEMIIKYNGIFLNLLDQMMKTCVYGEGVSAVFQKFTGFLPCYTVYVNAYDITNDHIVQMNQKNKGFINLLKKLTAQKEVNNLNIFAYLILPIQRVPRYELFIKGVLKVLPRTHKEFKGLQDLVANIKKAGDSLNEKRRESENKQLLKKFKHHLEIKKFDITGNDQRRLVKYGSINSKEYGPVIIFLLSDVILVSPTKTLVKDIDALIDKSKIKIKDIIPLFFIGLYSDEPTSFMVVSQKVTLTFVVSNEEEKDDWTMAIDEILARNNNTAMSRFYTVRHSLQIKNIEDIFYHGYLKMTLKMFEDFVKDKIVEINPKIDITPKKEEPLTLSSSQKLSPRVNSSFRGLRAFNDHEEEKERYCVVKGAYLYIYDSVKDSFVENGYHMKVTINAMSIESVIAVNNVSAFQLNICGKTLMATASSTSDKWKWISVLRSSFYRSLDRKTLVDEYKIISSKTDLRFYYHPSSTLILEKGKLADYIDLITSIPANTECADCGDTKVVNVDMSYGVFLCRDCSNFHKSELKSTIINMKSLYVKQKLEEVKIFTERGNLVVNEMAREKVPKDVTWPDPVDMRNSNSQRQEFIPVKYKDIPKYN